MPEMGSSSTEAELNELDINTIAVVATGRDGGGGVAMTFPVNEASVSPVSPSVIHRRLRQRLSESRGSSSVEEIKAKLKEADNRRQQFYDNLSSKARRSQRSPSRSLSQEEDLGRRIEAKLEQKSGCSRLFVKSKGATYDLAKTFGGLKINEKAAKSLLFEELALQIGSDATLKAAKSFFDRLEVHLRGRRGVSGPSGVENIDHLLKCVANPKHRCSFNPGGKVGGEKRPLSLAERSQSNLKLVRYPVKIVLCSYMIVGHPNAVFSGKGGHQTALVEASRNFILKFELLIKIILEGSSVNSSLEDCPDTFSAHLEAFDKAWCSYLYYFVVWKVKDAKLLEEDLVRAACQMELSMMHTCKLSRDGATGSLTHDMKAVRKQVTEDQVRLKEKVQNLSGVAGIRRMEKAISDVRANFLASKDTGNPFASPVAHIVSPVFSVSVDSSPTSVSGESSTSANRQSSGVVGSLCEEDNYTAAESVVNSSAPSSSDADVHLTHEAGPFTENEILVNEIVHEHHCGLPDKLDISDEDDDGTKAKIKETIEKAFWNNVMESVKQEHSDLSWVLRLMTEVRDELCGMSPASWREEITNTIDIDILAQVFSSGTLDVSDLGRILEYALVTLQKLSASAKDNEMKAAHQNLLTEVREISQPGDNDSCSSAIAMVKGLRFVLERIQILKKEISRARIVMIETMIKGPAGLEYLQNSFSNRYGPPSNAYSSLPLTKNWISLVKTDLEQVWSEHGKSLSALSASPAIPIQGIPPVILRTGGSVSATSRTLSLEHGRERNEQPECRGDGSDLLIRVGLMKLVSEVEGLTEEALPETLKLNVLRMRAIQSVMQKMIVISTSILILRQTLVTERLVTSPSSMENIIALVAMKLSELLDKVEDVGVKEIVEAMIGLSDEFSHVVDLAKLRASEGMVMNLLSKSLQSGDDVFFLVSQVVHLSARMAVLGGTGSRGRLLADTELRRVGAAFLTDKVMEAAEMLIVMTTVSTNVHGPWYEQLMMNL